MKNPPFSNDLKSFPYISMGFPFISSRFLWISIVQTGRHRASASQGVFTPCSSILTVESQSPNFALEKSFGFQKKICVIHIYNYHRIGWIENLQGTPLFDGKNHGFRFRFSSVYIYTHIKQVPRRVFMHHGIMSISCSDSAYDALSLNFNITSRIMETLWTNICV